MAARHEPVRTWVTLWLRPGRCSCGGLAWPCPEDRDQLAPIPDRPVRSRLTPGRVLRLGPADWQPSYGKPLRLTVVKVDPLRDTYEHGRWLWVAGYDEHHRWREVNVRDTAV